MKRLRPSRRPFCFHCGKQLAYVDGSVVFVAVVYFNSVVKLHKACVEEFQKDQRDAGFRSLPKKGAPE